MLDSVVIVSMAGYNAVCEIESCGRPALLVPRSLPREEQLRRAQQLAASGRAKMLRREVLDPHSLWRAVEELVDQPAPPPVEHQGGKTASERAAVLLGAA